ncbi:MAG: hypothetical protein KC442_02220, partial [Thermomicrobiales bacterium]|nr:hypothetical protein [Thermomicrobiales bacterium]
MLNDLLPLAEAMAAHGMAITPRHPGIKDMAKGGALYVTLGPDGDIGAILPLDAGRGSLWTIRDGQQNSFPGLPTDGALLAIPDDALAEHRARWKAAKTPAAKRLALGELVASYPFAAGAVAAWPGPRHRARIAERLAVLQPLAANRATAAVPEAHARFLRALQRDPGFLHDLYTRLTADDLDEGLYDWAGRAFTGKVALLFDVREADGLRAARDTAQIEPVSLALA